MTSRLLALIAVVLGTSCFDGDHCSDGPIYTNRYSKDAMCRMVGTDPCVAPRTCEEFCKRITQVFVSCRMLNEPDAGPETPIVECSEKTVCK